MQMNELLTTAVRTELYSVHAELRFLCFVISYQS